MYIYVFTCTFFMFFLSTVLHIWDIELKRHQLHFISGKYFVWKLKKYVNLNQTPLKTFSYKQINIFVEWMNEDSLFIVNVEHYMLCSRGKDSRKQVYIVSLGEEKEKRNLQLMPIELWNHMKPDYIDLSVWTLDRRNLISYFISSQSCTIYY